MSYTLIADESSSRYKVMIWFINGTYKEFSNVEYSEVDKSGQMYRIWYDTTTISKDKLRVMVAIPITQILKIQEIFENPSSNDKFLI